MTTFTRRSLYAVWLIFIGGFALLHALHLRADFPNHTPWFGDWAKYTDEGWYGNAAVRAHLFGNWYVPGDFNPAPAVPVWPLLEWLLFFVTGVSIQAARGLAVAFFLVNLILSYMLLRTRGPRWMALLAVTLLVTSPFLYCFSRLAILEPMLIALTLGALNLAARLPKMRRPVWTSMAIGLIFTLMMLTKSTAVFLLPALGWAMLAPLWSERRQAIRCALTAAVTFVATFGLWMAVLAGAGLMADYNYLFFINKYIKPTEVYWPVLSFWWSFHGGLWVDRVLIPLSGVIFLGTIAAWKLWDRQRGRELLFDPVFGASLWAIGGYILFMTYQNHPQPRYFAVVAFFCFFVVARGANSLMEASPASSSGSVSPTRWMAWGVIAIAAVASANNALVTLNYATHPEYTWVDAAQRLTNYIDAHPNGKRLLVSISGDEITLVTHLPTICDDFGTQDLVSKIGRYQPGYWATWNDIDPGTLEDLHNRYSLEQVAGFRAFDDPERNVLVLFKLHPLPGGKIRNPSEQNLQVVLPGDKIEIPIQ